MNEMISVIVPVYNIQEYIRACIASIVHQSYENLEILLVDDGSTDDSHAILEESSQQDPRIKVLRKPNGGLSDARNYGIERAQGSYLMFVDGDDLLPVDACRDLLSALEKENADIAVSNMEYFYSDGKRKKSSGGEFTVSSVKENPSLIAINNSACNKLYKKSLFDEIRFPVGKWYEDLAVVPILLYEASRIVKVDEPLYEYRQRSTSIAHSADPRIFDIYDALNNVQQYVQCHGREPAVLKQIHHLYVLHGLDLTTLRIKDFSNQESRAGYLKQNMEYLRKYCPDYKKDILYQKAGLKKKIIYSLLNAGRYNEVLKIYDR